MSTIIYTDHIALKSILINGSNNQRMQQWENRLGEYDEETH